MAEHTVAGIDVAAARPCTCVLVEDYEVRGWLDTKDLEQIRAWVCTHQPDAIAVDAPCAVSQGLLLASQGDGKPYGGRVCDRDLRRRNIPLYEVPRTRAAAHSWMEVGFQIYDVLGELGYLLPQEPGTTRSVIEVFPHASFVTLLGGIPAKKLKDLGQIQRLEVLGRHGLRLDSRVDHDSLDALVAALTAIKFLEGQASAVGDPEEALLWLPVDHPEESYRRLPAPVTHLELAELEHLHGILLPEERDELLQCLLIAAPRGGEAMIKMLEDELLCHATEELLREQGPTYPGGQT